MRRIKENIMKDLGWKFLSLIIAMGLWLMVINIQHPVDTRTYTQNIKMENLDLLNKQGLAVVNKTELENTKISIKVKAQRTALDRLAQSKADIKVTLDLQKAVNVESGDSILLPLDIKLPEISGAFFEIVGKTPEKVQVAIENIVTVEMPIKVTTKEISTDGFILENPVVTPSTVFLSGPMSIMNRVSDVKAQIDVETTGKDVLQRIPIEVYDVSGIPIKGITMSVKEVDVLIGVNRSKKIPIEAQAIGTPARGYALGEVSASLSYIEIMGKPDLLDTISKMTMPKTSVQQATETVTASYSLEELLPEGVVLKSTLSPIVTVSAVIEPETQKKFLIKISQITPEGELLNGQEFTIKDDAIPITLRGSQALFDTLFEADIRGSINLTGLVVGNQLVNVNFELPVGISIVGGIPNISVTVIEKDGQSITVPIDEEPKNEEPKNEIPKNETPKSDGTDEQA